MRAGVRLGTEADRPSPWLAVRLVAVLLVLLLLLAVLLLAVLLVAVRLVAVLHPVVARQERWLGVISSASTASSSPSGYHATSAVANRASWATTTRTPVGVRTSCTRP